MALGKFVASIDVPIAASMSSGSASRFTALLTIRPTSSLDAGNGQLSRSEAACGEADQHVLVRRLDTAATSEPALQGGAICSTVVMKLDTEGAEPLALLGAERVLFAACPPCLVMFEYKPIAVTKVAGGLQLAGAEVAKDAVLLEKVVEQDLQRFEKTARAASIP